MFYRALNTLCMPTERTKNVFQIPQSKLFNVEHSHKKRKHSLETRAERTALRTYVENQAILEPILL